MNGVYLLQKRLVKGLIAVVDRWVPSFSTPTTEFLGLAITVPSLLVLLAWLGSVLGLPVVLIQVAVMTLGLVLVTLFMVKQMLFYIRTEIAATPSTAPMNPAEDAGNSSEDQDLSE